MDDLGAVHVGGELLDELCALDGDVGDAVAVEPEDDPPLQGRRRVVQMHDRALGPHQALEGALDEMIAALGEHLHGDVVRDQVLVDELAQEIELRLRSGRETDFYFLEAHIHQHLEHAQLLAGVHGVDEGLVAVSQIHAAPHRRLGDDAAGPLPIRELDGLEGLIFLDGHQ